MWGTAFRYEPNDGLRGEMGGVIEQVREHNCPHTASRHLNLWMLNWLSSTGFHTTETYQQCFRKTFMEHSGLKALLFA